MTNTRLLILSALALVLLGGGVAAGHYLEKGGAAAAEGLGVFGGMIITHILTALRGGGSTSSGSSSGSSSDKPKRPARPTSTALRAHLVDANDHRRLGFRDHRMVRNAFALLLLAGIAVSCSSSAALTGIDVARRAIVAGRAGIPNFCTGTVDACIAAKLNQCPKLVECRKARRHFVGVLITTNVALKRATQLVQDGAPKATIASAVALFTGLVTDATRIAAVWGLKLPVPALGVSK